jgi:hypothetical protein
MWKSFADGAEPPKWIRQNRRPNTLPGRVKVTCFTNGWCPAQNLVFERAQRAAEETGPRVVFEGIDTSELEVFRDWGISDGLFIDGKEVRTGPPPSYASIQKRIARRCARLS